MNLFELTGVKKYHDFNQWKLRKILRRLGVSSVNGKYGEVFMHPKWNYVVKIFSDQPYLDFVEYAIKHPNKHFPKFLRKPLTMHAFHKRYEGDDHKFWVVKIEKLNEITDKDLLKCIVKEMEPLSYVDERGMNDRSPHYGCLLPTGEYRKNYSRNDLIKDYPWLGTLAEAYKEFSRSEHATGSPDIHAGNFMQRDDGTIVIIDPQWVGSNPEQEYYAALRREVDHGGWDYEPHEYKGPRYQHHIDAEKKAQAELDAANKLERQVAYDLGFDDDIPF